MKCPGSNEMAAYLDGVLTKTEDARWRMHFQQCEKCRRALEELRSLMVLGAVSPDPACIQKGKNIVRGERTLHGGHLSNGCGRNALSAETYN